MRQKNQKRIAHTVLQELQDAEQNPIVHKVLSYDVDDIVEQLKVYDDDGLGGLGDLLFTKDLTWVAGVLTQMVITRERDSATATKTFTYVDDYLTQVDVT